MSRRGRRISTRTLRYLFAAWQRRAGFDRLFNLHALPLYASPSDEDILRAARELPC